MRRMPCSVEAGRSNAICESIIPLLKIAECDFGLLPQKALELSAERIFIESRLCPNIDGIHRVETHSNVIVWTNSLSCRMYAERPNRRQWLDALCMPLMVLRGR